MARRILGRKKSSRPIGRGGKVGYYGETGVEIWGWQERLRGFRAV